MIGLIYKIKRIGITGSSLKLIENFCNDRFWRVVLNGQSSSWTPACAGVPQGSILGPLFFLIYINDLSKEISSTSIFSVVDDVNVSVVQLNNNCVEYQHGHISGKCLSILMFPNKPNRLFSLAKARNLLILPFFSIMFQLKDVPFRNIYEKINTKNVFASVNTI